MQSGQSITPLGSALIKRFTSLSVSTANDFSALFRGVRLPEGQILCNAGLPPRWVGYIRSGSIRQTCATMYASVQVYMPGELFAFDEVIRASSSFTFRAREDSVVDILDANTLLKAIVDGDIDLTKEPSVPTVPEVFESVVLPLIDSSHCDDQSAQAQAISLIGKYLLDGAIHVLSSNLESVDNLSSAFRIPEKSILYSSSFFIDQYPIGSRFSSDASLLKKGILPWRILSLSKACHAELESAFRPDHSEIATPVSGILQEIPVFTPHDESLKNHAASQALKDWYGDDELKIAYPELNITDIESTADQAIAVLRAATRYFQIPYKKDSLEQSIRSVAERSENSNLTLFSFATLLDLVDIKAELTEVPFSDLGRVRCPAVLLTQDLVPLLLWNVNTTHLIVAEANKPLAYLQSEDFRNIILSSSSNSLLQVLSLEKTKRALSKRFGLGWFLPALKEYKSTLALVIVASFFVQLLALLNPLLIQQIIDAVISQGNIQSLNVYGTILVAMAFSEGLLGSLRTFLLSDTTNRIDVTLGSVVIDHLMRLPLPFFGKRPVGEVSTRVNELEKIREFLTGTGLTTLLDISFSFIYIAVMLLYSVTLTLWTLSVIPLFLLLAYTVAPLIRRLVEQRAQAYARVQSHLVVGIAGVETVKTQKLEYQNKWRWRKLYNEQISLSFKNVVTGTSASSVAKFLDQLSGLIVIWVGASMVLRSELTVGQLIAFRIIAGYVTGPILRLATFWQNFQETAISIDRLGDVINSPTESEIHGAGLMPLPPIKGSVEFKNVSFRFSTTLPMQLHNISLRIPAGSFTGLVGGSGSGKSTLVKLIPALYQVEVGTVLIDAYDTSKADLYSIRSQIGIVPQDSLLFDGSVIENLRLSMPDASLEECKKAAEIACADEFIQMLPDGYASSVGERGSALSGGQRQRLAIARMILSRPSMVILDEATSALDVDTERRVLRNLRTFFATKTLIFITHRISTLKEADQIVVMHQGRIDEVGSHSELLALKGRYAALITQQYSEGLS